MAERKMMMIPKRKDIPASFICLPFKDINSGEGPFTANLAAFGLRISKLMMAKRANRPTKTCLIKPTVSQEVSKLMMAT